MNNLERAKEEFFSGKYTCVLCMGDTLYTSTESGIKPMVHFLSGGIDLKGFSAADRIVGKAAALLFVLARIKEIFADVLSEGALSVFQNHGIHCEYTTLVGNIINREGSGLCPMEETVKSIDDPREALKAIQNTLNRIRQKKNC